MANIEMKCIESTCRAPFTITDGEQEFFKSKGYELPKRCKECRAKRKAAKDGGTTHAPAAAAYKPTTEWVGGAEYAPPPSRSDRGTRRDRSRRRDMQAEY